MNAKKVFLFGERKDGFCLVTGKKAFLFGDGRDGFFVW